MTDEERAEEYADWFWGASSSEKRAIEQAYLAELEEENEGLKAFESHCDEIEEDAKAIAKENAELKEKLDKIRNYLANDIPHELMNEATNKIWRMV